jgi:hypothetical protein
MVIEMRENPRPQEIYRHFKGNIYQIVTLAHDSETLGWVVVYQQLYAPYEVYVRPLDMFMSRVDSEKYPDAKQAYRFEKIEPNQAFNTVDKPQKENKPEEVRKDDGEGEINLDPALLDFLDADSYEKKLEILSMLHPRITDDMINTMAVSLDTEVKEGDIETRYNEIKTCLLTMERFECNRLR